MLETWNKFEVVDTDSIYGIGNDYHLRYFPLDELENIRNAQHLNVEYHEFHSREDFSYLREKSFKIEDMGLTDKQMMAVSLVFYGGLKKKIAARIMKISSQALSDHLKAGLKKISHAFI
jgi:predicted DNA-binding protein (UPF0251 family)